MACSTCGEKCDRCDTLWPKVGDFYVKFDTEDDSDMLHSYGGSGLVTGDATLEKAIECGMTSMSFNTQKPERFTVVQCTSPLGGFETVYEYDPEE